MKEKILGADTAVIVVTAHGGVAGAVEAMRLGAADYLVKPFETEELPLVLERARRSRHRPGRKSIGGATGPRKGSGSGTH